VSMPVNAQPQRERAPRLSAGPLIIHPRFSVDESYDENLFSTESNEVDDLLSQSPRSMTRLISLAIPRQLKMPVECLLFLP